MKRGARPFPASFYMPVSPLACGSSPLQRRPFLGDERQVVPHMPHGLEHQLPQRDEAGFAVNADTLPRFGRLQTQDACAMPPQRREQVELFGEVERLVVQPFGVGRSSTPISSGRSRAMVRSMRSVK